jgi:hypothetical protein
MANYSHTNTIILWSENKELEVAHAQLSSLTINLIVAYSVGQTFDYSKYEPNILLIVIST